MRVTRALPAIVLLAAAVACSSSSGAPLAVPKAPIPAPMSYPPASASLADHMLHAPDLGAGWYQGTTPAVITVKANLPAGASAQAQTLLSAMHRSGREWEMDGGVSEGAFSFPQPAAARRYVASWLRTETAPHAVGFVVGSTAYILSYFVNSAAHAPVLPKAKVVTIAKQLARASV